MAGPEGKFHASMFLYLFSHCLIKLSMFLQPLLTSENPEKSLKTQGVSIASPQPLFPPHSVHDLKLKRTPEATQTGKK